MNNANIVAAAVANTEIPANVSVSISGNEVDISVDALRGWGVSVYIREAGFDGVQTVVVSARATSAVSPALMMDCAMAQITAAKIAEKIQAALVRA